MKDLSYSSKKSNDEIREERRKRHTDKKVQEIRSKKSEKEEKGYERLTAESEHHDVDHDRDA